METKNLVFGIITGALVGAGTALLLAPKSGEDMRYSLKSGTASAASSASDFAVTAKEKTQLATTRGQEIIQMIREITPVVQEAISVVKEWKEVLQTSAGELKTEVQGFKSSESSSDDSSHSAQSSTSSQSSSSQALPEGRTPSSVGF
ncbi:YtxH domain-containing protein [Paenibacillus dauci]|uniref:YtxH domain-containing protein n=1 Tax=Paenibacillus dauci TaxID=1567106 RepID=UPI0006198565|nr:YtxH domain-containing protein [Paenibacillus dauci]